MPSHLNPIRQRGLIGVLLTLLAFCAFYAGLWLVYSSLAWGWTAGRLTIGGVLLAAGGCLAVSGINRLTAN